MERTGNSQQQEQASAQVTRRSFLAWLVIGWAGVLTALAGTAATTIRYLFPNVLYEPPQVFKLGKLEEYPLGKITYLADPQCVFVVHDQGGIGVMSAICTHLRCTVGLQESDKASPYHCPCHGSVFDRSGAVLKGPAPSSLPWFKVQVGRDGRLLVDATKVVAADFRVKV